MLLKYILIDTALFTALMRNELKGYASVEGKYVEDEEQTLRVVDLNDPPPTQYYVLKWSGDRPSSVPPRYSESGTNPKNNKIFTHEEIVEYLAANAKQPEI